MFNLADRTFERVPNMMPLSVALATLDRVRDHVALQERRTFGLVLHGGEPTLWPASNLATLLERARSLRDEGVKVNVTMQTNAVHVSEQHVEILDEYGVRLGISLDGPVEVNDAYRTTHSGRGSYEVVEATVQRLVNRGLDHLVGGFLAVAHPEIPPKEFLKWADSLPVRKLDVLWPMHFNYDSPPWAEGDVDEYLEMPRIGRWFAELLDAWLAADDPTLVIRFFYECIEVVLGGRKHSDMIVNDHLDMLVVNTDGRIEYPDYFRAARDGGCRTEFNVWDHSLEDVAKDPVFAHCLDLGAHLPQECNRCPHVAICGGGFLPGRLSKTTTLPEKRSILCADHFYFFTAFNQLVRGLLPQATPPSPAPAAPREG